MGRTVYFTQTASVPLFQEPVDYIKDAVVFAVMTDRNIANEIITANLRSIPFKIPKYVDYARDVYLDGLPVTTRNDFKINDAALNSHVAAHYGLTSSQIATTNRNVGRFLEEHAVYQYLAENYFWYGENFDRLYTDSTRTTLLGTFTDFVKTTGNKLTLYYLPDGAMDVEELAIIDDGNDDEYYYRVTFQVPTGVNNFVDDQDYYFIFSGTTTNNPALVIPADANLDSTYIPIVRIRWENKDVIDYPNTTRYVQTKELVDRIGLDLDDLTGAYKEHEDQDKMINVYLMNGININSIEREDIAYYGEFLKSLWETGDYTNSQPETWHKVTCTENSFSAEFYFRYFTATEGTWTNDAGEVYEDPVAIPYHFEKSYIDFDDIISGIPEAERPTKIAENPEFFTGSLSVRITHPDDKTKYTFYQVRQCYVKHRIDTFNSDGIREVNGVILAPHHQSLIQAAYFPIDFEILERLPTRVRSDVIYRSFNLTVYIVDRTELKWYEDPEVLKYVGFILTAIALFVGAGQIATALTTGGLAGAAWALGKILLSITLVDYATVWLVDKLGDLGAVLAVAVASYYFAGGRVNISNITAGMPSVNSLIQAVTGIAKGVSAVNEVNRQKLMEEYGEFTEYLEEQTKTLDELEDQLGVNSLNFPIHMLDTDYSIDLVSPSYESVSNYYERTSHTMNPGVQTLDWIPSFVDNALTLPKI